MNITLRYDPALTAGAGEGAWRLCGVDAEGARVSIEATVRIGEKPRAWVFVTARVHTREVVPGPEPILSRVDETTWRLEPGTWSTRQGLPHAIALVLAGAPADFPNEAS